MEIRQIFENIQIRNLGDSVWEDAAEISKGLLLDVQRRANIAFKADNVLCKRKTECCSVVATAEIEVLTFSAPSSANFSSHGDGLRKSLGEIRP